MIASKARTVPVTSLALLAAVSLAHVQSTAFAQPVFYQSVSQEWGYGVGIANAFKKELGDNSESFFDQSGAVDLNEQWQATVGLTFNGPGHTVSIDLDYTSSFSEQGFAVNSIAAGSATGPFWGQPGLSGGYYKYGQTSVQFILSEQAVVSWELGGPFNSSFVNIMTGEIIASGSNDMHGGILQLEPGAYTMTHGGNTIQSNVQDGGVLDPSSLEFVMSFQVIPAPGSIALLGGGMLLAIRRRR